MPTRWHATDSRADKRLAHLRKCKNCQGLWLRHDDLEAILKLGRQEVEDRMQVVPEDHNKYHPSTPTGYMRCPACDNGRLQTIDITFTQQVKVDRCDTCFGYWIDHSELDAIVAEEARLEAYNSEARREAREAERTRAGNPSYPPNESHEYLAADGSPPWFPERMPRHIFESASGGLKAHLQRL